jgi:hypothetical protein
VTPEGITIRWAGPADHSALAALAALESRPLPRAPLLVAERDGAVLAALPVGIGAPPLADPFTRSGELVALLELRAEQLRRAERPRRAERLPRLPLARPRFH